MAFDKGIPLFPGHLPKIKRRKSRPGGWRRAKVTTDRDGKVVVVVRHDDVLNACIDIVEAHGLSYMHVPNELYRLCAIGDYYGSDQLPFVFERQLGINLALALKRKLMEAFKGVIDLIVWYPLSDGINLSLQGDVKIGRDKLNHAQKVWATQNSIKTWASVDEFMIDFNRFLKKGKQLEPECKAEGV
jgi:hypothetical protein